MSTDLEKYIEACTYPGNLDPTAVESGLQKYLGALGVQRQIRRLARGWDLQTETHLKATVELLLSDFARARDARAAIAASAAIDARDAIDASAARDARDAIDASAARDARCCP